MQSLLNDLVSSIVFVSNEPVFWLIAVFTVLIGGISKGGFGGGLVLLCVPLLSTQISPLIATALLLPILCVMDITGLVTFWRKWHMPSVLVLIPGSLVGIGLGAWVFTSLSVNGVKLVIGSIAVIFTLHHWGKTWLKLPERKHGRFVGFLLGTVAGFTSHVAHAGSPPFSMYMLPKRLPREQYVATTVIIFAVINYVKLVPYSFTGQFTVPVLWTCLVLAPLAPIGVMLGRFMLQRINEALFYRISYLLVFLAGLKLLYEALIQP